jgi:C-terminal processing protease CtpA/Prc
VVQSYSDSYGREIENNANSINFITRYFFKFKPSYKINKVLKNSPSDKAGLLVGDVILKINGKKAHEFNLNQIMYKFRERDKNKITMQIDRNGRKMEFKFRLEKKI